MVFIERCSSCQSDRIKAVSIYKYHNIYECQNCDSWTYKKIDTCCRNSDELYAIDYYEGVPKFIRLQCINCGGCLKMTKPLPFNLYSHLVTDEFSKIRFNEWKNEIQFEKKLIYEIATNIKFFNSNFYKYTIYLQSANWKNIREAALIRDKYSCQYCQKAIATEVHHLTYEHLGCELLEDLISCCKACHFKKHKL